MRLVLNLHIKCTPGQQNTIFEHFWVRARENISNTRVNRDLPLGQFKVMVQRTANENAACLRRICKRSDQPKIERIANNDARLILRRNDDMLLIFNMVWP